MPIYEYQCLKCEKPHEAIQKVGELPLTKCPHCGGETKKILSKTAFHLKGGGWYADGYSSKNPSKSQEPKPQTKGEKSEKSEKSGGEPPKEQKKESKPTGD